MQIEVTSLVDLGELEDQVRNQAELAMTAVQSVRVDGLHFLHKMKFEAIGRHPLESRDLK